jgi:quercetin dioxygenase-like cupin family protein
MTANQPLRPPRDAAELDEAIGLLTQALAPAWPSREPPAATLRARLLQRVAASAARHQGLVTVRRDHGTPIELAPGVSARWLYRSDQPAALRPGEPVALALLELAAGASLTAGLGLAGQGSEWLVARGECQLDGINLTLLDQHCRAAAPTEPVLSSARGATIYLRNSGDVALPAGTSRERDAVWEDFGPGIRRRLVWQQGNEACYLARAAAGAFVPAHGHHLDEECLMLEGELFLGDILLRAGEFQLAPAGHEHGIVQAASETLLYVRGDIVPAVELLS